MRGRFDGRALAHFVCRNLRRYDGGDHLIVIGELKHCDRFAGALLVFHAGAYQVATRHPECAP